MEKPWMKDYEISFLELVLCTVKPKKVLEWGAGYSTNWFSTYLHNHGIQPELWLSIEHNASWVKEISSMPFQPFVRIDHIPPEVTKPHGYFRSHFLSYIQHPRDLAPFDLVLVDGRARIHCLREIAPFLTPSGVVILHDANRLKYLPGRLFYPHGIGRYDFRLHEGGIWVGSPDKIIIKTISQGLKNSGQSRWKPMGTFLRGGFLNKPGQRQEKILDDQQGMI